MVARSMHVYWETEGVSTVFAFANEQKYLQFKCNRKLKVRL